MTTPLEKIAEEKTGNYQSSLKGGGGVPHDQYISGFFLKKKHLLLKNDLNAQKHVKSE